MVASGPRRGEPDRRRRWHPACVDAYLESDPRTTRRRAYRRDRGVCGGCGLDTYALRRTLWAKWGPPGKRYRHRRQPPRLAEALRERGFVPGRSLWELDHVVPLVEGGGHEEANLQTLCVPCHKAKSAAEASRRADRAAQARPAGSVDTALTTADETNARVEAALASLESVG